MLKTILGWKFTALCIYIKKEHNFLWPFKLSFPQRGMRRKTTHFVEVGDVNNREDQINRFIRRMNKVSTRIIFEIESINK